MAKRKPITEGTTKTKTSWNRRGTKRWKVTYELLAVKKPAKAKTAKAKTTKAKTAKARTAKAKTAKAN